MKSTRSVGQTAVLLGIFAGCVFSGLAQTNPVFATNLTGTFGPLAVAGNYLFSAGSSYPPAPALRILQISDPVHPVDLGYQDGGGQLTGLVLSGPHAYIGSYAGGGYDAGLTFLDISNPTNPTVSGIILGASTDAIAVLGSGAYLMDNQTDFPHMGVWIYDISDPASPSYLGLAPINDYGSPAVSWLFARDKYLFAIGFYGLYVIDVSDPVSPRRLSYVPGAGALGVSGAELYQNNVYVTDFTNGLWIADVSSPTNPVIVYHQFGLSTDLRGVAISGNYAYVGLGPGMGGNPGGVLVYDISNPTNTALVAGVSSRSLDYGYSLRVAGSHLYAVGNSGLSVYSLGTPPPLALTITSTLTNNLLLSWPTPAPAFAVQQNANLNPTNWLTLPNTPVVVGTNNQVTIPKPSGTMFYRLVSQ